MQFCPDFTWLLYVHLDKLQNAYPRAEQNKWLGQTALPIKFSLLIENRAEVDFIFYVPE